MQPTPNYMLLGAVLFVGLLVAGTVGYLFGSYSATQSINEQLVAEKKENIEVVDTNVNVETNPLKDIKTNPLEDVKTNPYDVKLNPFD
ncbi:MAG: hypothetical protein AAB947_01440 [Patescibacteria group bacterium]